ncbi:PIN domain-containing protein [Dehalococcoidia bacterium]|nr:PIN domain-containing protein [Dehalococcoidia bacterium]
MGMVFLDTNILVYASNRSSPYYKRARAVISQIDSRKLEACLSTQVLAEFYATVTGPKRVERPLTPTEAANVVVKFVEADIPKFCPQVSTLKHVLDLAKRLQIRESDFFDALL